MSSRIMWFFAGAATSGVLGLWRLNRDVAGSSATLARQLDDLAASQESATTLLSSQLTTLEQRVAVCEESQSLVDPKYKETKSQLATLEEMALQHTGEIASIQIMLDERQAPN